MLALSFPSMRPLLLALLVLSAASPMAQTTFRPVPEGPSVSIDALVALGDDTESLWTDQNGVSLGSSTLETTTSALLLAGRFPIGRVTIVAELPFAYVSYNQSLGDVAPPIDASDTALGNPYLGLAVQSGLVEIEGGVRLPLASQETPPLDAFSADAVIAAFTLDPERFEAYAVDVFTATLAARTRVELVPGVRAEFRLAPALVVETQDAPADNASILALGYGLQLAADAGPLAVHGGVIGRRFFSADRYSLFDVDATVVLGARFVRAPVQPGVLVRVPVSDDYFGTDAVVGLSLDVPLR